MTNPPIHEELVQKLVRVYDEGPNRSLGVFQIPVAAYTDQARLEAERRLLRSLPMPVAHVSQVQSAGSCLVHDALGVPILITRNREGELRAMLNVCRHRGTRLLEDAGFCNVRKGFHCRYHGWTYDLDGNLTQVPREELFPALDKRALSLRSLPVTERFGFVWVVATPGADHDFDAFLDPLEPDLGPSSKTTAATRSSLAPIFARSSGAVAFARRRPVTRLKIFATSPRRRTSSSRTRSSSRSRTS